MTSSKEKIDIQIGIANEFCSQCKKKTKWRLDEKNKLRCLVCGNVDFEK